ncbi:MAG: ABC transporter permease [Actinobacteria bacterium]|nr:ABC transporter permease [Actinomycetota bacterium]
MTKPVRSYRSRQTRAVGAILTLGIPGLFLLLFVAVPLGIVLVSAFFKRGRIGGFKPEFTLENFAELTRPVYAQVLGSSLLMSATVTLICLVVAYAAVWAMRTLTPRGRIIALVAILIPFWTSFLIRAYAWMLLLGDAGTINGALQLFGVIETPLRMLYSPEAVILVLVYLYLPLMILPLAASAEGLDSSLGDAARNLGASPWRSFRTVDLPLTLPGALTGAVLVFVPSMSNFVVPDLIGGGRVLLIGNVIQDQFLVARNWPLGSVLALVLLLLLVLLLVAQSMVIRRIQGGSK